MTELQLLDLARFLDVSVTECRDCFEGRPVDTITRRLIERGARFFALPVPPRPGHLEPLPPLEGSYCGPTRNASPSETKDGQQ